MLFPFITSALSASDPVDHPWDREGVSASELCLDWGFALREDLPSGAGWGATDGPSARQLMQITCVNGFVALIEQHEAVWRWIGDRDAEPVGFGGGVEGGEPAPAADGSSRAGRR